MTLRRTLLLMLLLATTLAAAPTVDPADAAVRRSLCAATANLRDSPEGFIIARLRRPQRVTVYRRSANRRWSQVQLRSGLAGWLPSRSLCRGR